MVGVDLEALLLRRFFAAEWLAGPASRLHRLDET